MDAGWAALARHLPAASGTGAASQEGSRDVRSRRCPPGGSSDRLVGPRHESRCYAPLAGSSSCRFSRDGRASRVRCGRCRRGATVGAARVRRSAQPPSHRRTPRAPSAAASATHASDGSAARAAPRPPHQTHQPPGQGLPSGARLTCSTRAPYRAPTPAKDQPKEPCSCTDRDAIVGMNAIAVRTTCRTARISCTDSKRERSTGHVGQRGHSAIVGAWAVGSLRAGWGHHRAWLMRNTWPSG